MILQLTAPKSKTNNEIPGLKGLPLVDNLPQFQRRPLPTLIKAAREGGDVVRITLGSQRLYLLSNPDHVRHVLQDNNKNYVKGYQAQGPAWERARVKRGVPLATPAEPHAAGLPPAPGRGSQAR